MRQLFDDAETVIVPTPTPSGLMGAPGLPELPRFALIELLGEGGFAVVYRARQLEPVVREVAVKLLKGQMATPDVLARFEVERRTLARMEHTGIARLWDAGLTHAGQPFLPWNWCWVCR
jgi:serine/threonine protein kinase